MKKFLALMVAVMLLAFAGSAFAGDSDVGHVTPIIIEIGGSGGTTTTIVYVVTTIVDNVVNVTFFTDTAVVNPDDIPQVAQQTLNTINNNPTSFGLPAGTQISGNNADIKSASDTTHTTTEAQQQAAAKVKQKYGDNFTSLATVGSITISKSQSSAAVFKAATDTGDYYVIELKLADSAKGLSIYGDTNPSDNPSLPSVSGAAADDDTTIRFINSSGDLVTTVPDDGVVNMVLYLREGVVYTPLVYTRTSEIDSSKLETVASVEVVTYDYEEIVAKSNTIFSTAVDGTVIKALNDATGKQYRTLAASEVADEGWTFSTAENTFVEQTTGRSFDLIAVNVMPSFTVDSGSYVAAISFDRSGFDSSRTLFDATNFVVYPNTVADGAEGSAKIFTVNNGQVSDVTPAQVVNGSVVTAYIAFTTNNSAMSASGFNASAAATFRPSVFVKRAVTTSGGDEPTPTPVNPGSSGGGCDAGFGALALAVLGAFMVTRRK